MNRASCKLWLLAALLPILVACGSTPLSKHYVLTAPDSALPTGTSPALGIGPVSISGYLNRDSLVHRENGNRLVVSSTERWAEPLEEGIIRVVGLNLAGLLDTKNVRRYPWHPARAPVYGVKLSILEMNAASDKVNLVVDWLVYRAADATTVESHLSRRTEALPVGADNADTVVRLYSEMLYQLSEDIAAAIRRAETEGTKAAP